MKNKEGNASDAEIIKSVKIMDKIKVSVCCKAELIYRTFDFGLLPYIETVCSMCGAIEPETIKISQEEFDRLEGIEE